MALDKSYSTLITIPDYYQRFNYLKLNGEVGFQTFGSHRYLNQAFYNSAEWKEFRRRIILRDNGNDLAHTDVPIQGQIYIHHLNPISIEDILQKRLDILLNPENVVCVSYNTHQAIHYGSIDLLGPITLVERRPNDTCPWKGVV
jgi:hypothetical protein